MEKSTAIFYWFCKKKKCFVTIKIIFWLSVHNYLIVFPVEIVSSSKSIWIQFQYVIWFILYLFEFCKFVDISVDLFGHWWFYLLFISRFIARKLKGSNMAWIVFKETLLVPYFYMQKLLLGGNIFLDNVSMDCEKENKFRKCKSRRRLTWWTSSTGWLYSFSVAV